MFKISLLMRSIIYGCLQSPGYFAPGFTPEYFTRNLELNSFNILSSGSISSPRNCRAVHSQPVWLRVKGYENSLFYAFLSYKPFLRLFFLCGMQGRNLLWRSPPTRSLAILTALPNHGFLRNWN